MKTRLCMSLLFAASAAALAGCAGGGDDFNDVSYSSVSGNITPELRGTVERPIDIDMHRSQVSDMNARLMWDDLGRLFLTDRPSLMTPWPLASPSGLPR